MTGFGRSEIRNGRYEISVEIRSLNNRYLDIGLKLPKALNSYELDLKELIKKKIIRGKISAVVGFKNLTITNGDFRLKNETVQFYYQLLDQIRSQTGLNDEITLNHLLNFKELVEPEELVLEDIEIKEHLKNVFSKAVDDLDVM
ncbi:MAG: YicC/YloC family endoribonuclease, partial [Promethearchaeota archaeon]